MPKTTFFIALYFLANIITDLFQRPGTIAADGEKEGEENPPLLYRLSEAPRTLQCTYY